MFNFFVEVKDHTRRKKKDITKILKKKLEKAVRSTVHESFVDVASSSRMGIVDIKKKTINYILRSEIYKLYKLR